MTTIARCSTIQQATRFKMILESFGIPCFIPDEESATIGPDVFLTTSPGVRLQVSETSANEARRILDSVKEE